MVHGPHIGYGHSGGVPFPPRDLVWISIIRLLVAYLSDLKKAGAGDWDPPPINIYIYIIIYIYNYITNFNNWLNILCSTVNVIIKRI